MALFKCFPVSGVLINFLTRFEVQTENGLEYFKNVQMRLNQRLIKLQISDTRENKRGLLCWYILENLEVRHDLQ
jgi:hypothetical protein